MSAMDQARKLTIESAREKACTDFNSDRQAGHKGEYPVVWNEWVSLLESASDEIKEKYRNAKNSLIGQRDLLQKSVNKASEELSKLEDKLRSTIHSYNEEIEKKKSRISTVEKELQADEVPSINPSRYKLYMAIFAICEMPINWWAFQSLELPNLVIIAVLTIVVGIILAFAAHHVGQSIRQGLPVTSNHVGRRQRIKTIISITCWITGIIVGYAFITAFREVSLDSDSFQLFTFLMLVNIGLFAMMVILSIKAHLPNSKSHNDFNNNLDEIDSLKKDIEDIEEKKEKEKKSLDKEISEKKKWIDNNERRIIAVETEMRKILDDARIRQEQLDNQLQSVIAAYIDEYASMITNKQERPGWFGSPPTLHVSILDENGEA